MKLFLVAGTALVLIVAAASAQQSPHDGHNAHGGHGTPAPASTKEFEAANSRMHKDMAIVFSGNADVDFVRGMIPHHQGAIDMAKVVLRHGKDPETRALAEGVIKAQEQEIRQMQDWLKKKGQ
jgi:uncharacterized protein (DUF305 family)